MDDIIPIGDEITTFSDYLNNNCRGILSARFGDRKSFFLNEVKKQLAEKYIFLTIYPINYQVAENKDIFEYIKRDILLQILMTSEIDFSDQKYGFSLRLWGFLNQHGKDLVSDIVSLIASSLANIPQDAIKVFRNNIAKFKDFSEKADHSQSDNIESYLDEFACQKGGIYEFDPISRIIYQLITDIKENSGKHVILVIEDMDRIDPAHIFRILNVFSAHWDMQDYSEQKLAHGNPLNKYNFDKVLLVCHFQNIKNIFHHLYGERTDFTGYIHKFSPSTPYEYSLKDVIEEWIFKKLPFNKEVFPDVCTQLTSLIISQYGNSENILTNIRHITDFLNQSNYNIKKNDIEFQDKNYTISPINEITRLLCILKNFNISINDFLDSFTLTSPEKDVAHHQQISRLINQCWLVYPYINTLKNKFFNFDNASEHKIVCRHENYYYEIACKTRVIKQNTFLPKYEIQFMQIDMVNSRIFAPLFCSKESYSKILSFFNDYIY